MPTTKSLLFLIFYLFLTESKWEISSTEGEVPEPRYINQFVNTNQSLILLGGKHNTNSGFDDMWEWKNGRWTLLGKTPMKLWDHSFTYLKNENQIFLFGGRAFELIQGEEQRIDLSGSWVFSNNQWEKLDIAGPEARSSHTMVVHQETGKVILFGGRNSEKVFGDTWSFDGKKWLKIGEVGPSARYGHSFAYDPVSKMAYLFGGFDGDKFLNDLWAFDGIDWKIINSNSNPTPRMAHAMQFDNNGNGVLFGGWTNASNVSRETWVLTDEKWNKLQLEESPQGRLSCAIGYNQSRNEFVLFGGSTGFNGVFLPETWILSLENR